MLGYEIGGLEYIYDFARSQFVRNCSGTMEMVDLHFQFPVKFDSTKYCVYLRAVHLNCNEHGVQSVGCKAPRVVQSDSPT
jgi:hypothetical protein